MSNFFSKELLNSVKATAQLEQEFKAYGKCVKHSDSNGSSNAIVLNGEVLIVSQSVILEEHQ